MNILVYSCKERQKRQQIDRMMSSQANQQSVDEKLFQKWMYKNTNQKPKSYRDYYRNLSKPLDYIHNQKIQKAQQDSSQIRRNLKGNMEKILDLSNSLYKKVISRDSIEFNFGQKRNQSNRWQFQDQSNRAAVSNNSGFAMSKKANKEIMIKQYRFNEGEHKKKKLLKDPADQSQEPLTFSHIKMIDSPQFNEKAVNCQFFDIFRTDTPYNYQQKFLNNKSKFANNQNAQKAIQNMKYQIVDLSSYIGQKSKIIPFNCQKQMQFYKKKINNDPNQEQDVLGSCSILNMESPTILNMLDVAAGFIDVDALYTFKALKVRHTSNKQAQRNTDNLEQQYAQVKKQLEQIREDKMKNKQMKVPIRWADRHTQTLDPLVDASVNDFFESSINQNIIQLQRLKKVRQRILKNETNKIQRNKMIKNCNQKIRELLFKMLVLLTKGQKIKSYSEMFMCQHEKDFQKRLLDIIYQNFNVFVKESIDGVSKIQIINIYIQERKSCDQIMEVINERWN